MRVGDLAIISLTAGDEGSSSSDRLRRKAELGHRPKELRVLAEWEEIMHVRGSPWLKIRTFA